MKLIKCILAVLVGLSMILPGNVHAIEISGVKFNEQISDEGVQMRLQGAVLKNVVFFKAFAAGYYKGTNLNSNKLGDFPKRIEVEYFVSIPSEKMNNFTVKSMKENVSKLEFKEIKEKLPLMNRYFVDLKPGDRYSLTYIPGVGTKFVHNGQLIGTIKGKVFAKALFSTWIGQKPFDKKIKEEILGQKRAYFNNINLFSQSSES